MKKVIAWMVLAALAGGWGAVPARAEPARVTVTTTLLADVARAVGGAHVTVQGLMGPGTDPHTYKATAGDVAKLRGADLILYHGLHLEGTMTEVFQRLGGQGKRVLAVTETLPAERLLNSSGYAGAHDPHVWFDPTLWAECAAPVAEALAALRPAAAADFRANAAAWRAEVLALDDWARAELARVPAGQRTLVTSHDAYEYLGRRYGYEVVGVQGLSTVTEAGLNDIVRIADLVKQRGLKAVFVESSVSPATIRRIAGDTGVRIGGELFSDALGAPGDLRPLRDGSRADVGTWAGMFRYNVATVVAGLLGEAGEGRP